MLSSYNTFWHRGIKNYCTQWKKKICRCF